MRPRRRPPLLTYLLTYIFYKGYMWFFSSGRSDQSKQSTLMLHSVVH